MRRLGWVFIAAQVSGCYLALKCGGPVGVCDAGSAADVASDAPTPLDVPDVKRQEDQGFKCARKAWVRGMR